MRGSWKLSLIVLVLLGLLVVPLTACSKSDGAEQGNTTTTSATTGGSAGGTGSTASTTGPASAGGSTVLKPGLYEQKDGTVQVVGILTYRNLEGGFWAVVDTVDAAQAANAKILGVLGSSSEIPGRITSYEGKYVSVSGLQRDVSTYQAGPFVEVQSIRVLTQKPTS